MATTLIKNVRIINEGIDRIGDVFLRNERIEPSSLQPTASLKEMVAY
jgi:dihydroorotase-like cyclic amidohydrolase